MNFRERLSSLLETLVLIIIDTETNRRLAAGVVPYLPPLMALEQPVYTWECPASVWGVWEFALGTGILHST